MNQKTKVNEQIPATGKYILYLGANKLTFVNGILDNIKTRNGDTITKDFFEFFANLSKASFANEYEAGIALCKLSIIKEENLPK